MCMFNCELFLHFLPYTFLIYDFFSDIWLFKVLKMCKNLEKILIMKIPFGLFNFTHFSIFEQKAFFHELPEWHFHELPECHFYCLFLKVSSHFDYFFNNRLWFQTSGLHQHSARNGRTVQYSTVQYISTVRETGQK